MTTTETTDLLLTKCPKCGSRIQQRYQEKPDMKPSSWRHRCYAKGCRYDSGWQPWPPPWMRVEALQVPPTPRIIPGTGFTYDQLAKGNRARNAILNSAIDNLRKARRLTGHVPETRDRIDEAIRKVIECLT